MSWNIQKPGDYINGPLTVIGSATITGDLTVDTSTLKVDSANNRVGIGTTSPGYKLIVNAASADGMQFENSSDSNRGGRITSTGTAGTGKFGITTTSSGYALSFGIDAVEKMLLDTAGNVGIGVASPAGKLDVNVGAGGFGYFRSTTYSNLELIGRSGGAGSGGCQLFLTTTGSRSWLIGQRTDTAYGAANSFFIRDDTATATRLEIDTSGNVGIGVTPANNKFQVAGNIGLPNSCTASGETSGVFSIDVANLLTLTGGSWRQASILVVYSGIDGTATNPTILQTVVTLTGLSTWNAISKNDIVGTASVAVSNDTTTGARITVTVPTGNSGTVYAVLLGGAGATTRPSMTINA